MENSKKQSRILLNPTALFSSSLFSSFVFMNDEGSHCVSCSILLVFFWNLHELIVNIPSSACICWHALFFKKRKEMVLFMWRYASLNISEENKKLSLDGCADRKIYTYDLIGMTLQTPYKHCLRIICRICALWSSQINKQQCGTVKALKCCIFGCWSLH